MHGVRTNIVLRVQCVDEFSFCMAHALPVVGHMINSAAVARKRACQTESKWEEDLNDCDMALSGKGKLIGVIGDEVRKKGGASSSSSKRKCVNPHCVQDTCVGFLLGGIGEMNKNRQPNFMVVSKDTPLTDIEDCLKKFIKRSDIEIILINQNVTYLSAVLCGSLSVQGKRVADRRDDQAHDRPAHGAHPRHPGDPFQGQPLRPRQGLYLEAGQGPLQCRGHALSARNSALHCCVFRHNLFNVVIIRYYVALNNSDSICAFYCYASSACLRRSTSTLPRLREAASPSRIGL